MMRTMGVDENYDWAAATASALEWWRDAGVDALVDDAPHDWLAEPAALAAVPAPANGSPALPVTLAEFLAWRGGGDAPDAGWSGPTIASSGPASPALMVLADCPDRDDEGVLLGGGASGRLFARMLAAIGLAREDVHVAALCWRRPTAGRMPREVEARLGELARHHIALVEPKRLLLLGKAASQAILSADVGEARGNLHAVNHDRGTVSAAATYHPRFLIEKPACKADCWKDLRMLMRHDGDMAP
ncbi:MAG TPA: uracil-DNA glycosylase [Sphingomonas sp.]|jgi:DNA polymerase|nr:uracil-DNA glycosylase [Sphingomonas sp.]